MTCLRAINWIRGSNSKDRVDWYPTHLLIGSEASAKAQSKNKKGEMDPKIMGWDPIGVGGHVNNKGQLQFRICDAKPACGARTIGTYLIELSIFLLIKEVMNIA